MRIDFEALVGDELWERYWTVFDGLMGDMQRCQDVSDQVRERIEESLS